MRVVSFVPSWTETLVLAGVNVVGRTRFCIHPHESVKDIRVVGGTKDWMWEKIREINPDLILLDQEENPKFMAEQTEIPWYSTHVENVSDMPATLLKLSERLANQKLKTLSERWDSVLKKQPLPARNGLSDLPGILEWGLRPPGPIKNTVYMIWKDPWMCVSSDTFVGSVLERIGVRIAAYPEKYPKINLEDYSPEDTLILFSSEPYPFYKKKKEFSSFAYPHAFVDGEKFSWFGVRSLSFLEQALGGK